MDDSSSRAAKALSGPLNWREKLQKDYKELKKRCEQGESREAMMISEYKDKFKLFLEGLKDSEKLAGYIYAPSGRAGQYTRTQQVISKWTGMPCFEWNDVRGKHIVFVYEEHTIEWFTSLPNARRICWFWIA